MTIMIDDWPKVLRQVESLSQQESELIGAYKELLKRLKQEFGLKSLKEAEKRLREQEGKERQMAVKFTSRKKAFLKKHRKTLK